MTSRRPKAADRPAKAPPCPTCGRPVAAGGPDRPFCSARCRWVDLGRWFNEEFRVPGEAAIERDGFEPVGGGESRGEEEGPSHGRDA